ncbi:hypothetical protein MKY37_16645 [Psychrobacillus sp. FSL K6-2836]|uniref:hypothetical protein n=1 Tax=Psychrobacillus sp. FSL K6-2836 TaxID=2921548 RepID=UPI0030F5919E
MKKCTIGAGILTAMMLFSPIAGDYTEASTQTTQQDTQKVMWGKNELSQTQIGRIVFSKDVKIYKRGTDGKVSFHMNAKKGSMWRVHKITTEGNMNVYDLGGGVRVKQSNLSTYEKAPSDLIAKQMKQNNNGAFLTWEERGMNHGVFKHPYIHKLANESVKNKINEVIRMSFSPDIGEPDVSNITYLVLENANNRLVIERGATYTAYETGDSNRSYMRFTFDLTTGEYTGEYW